MHLIPAQPVKASNDCSLHAFDLKLLITHRGALALRVSPCGHRTTQDEQYGIAQHITPSGPACTVQKGVTAP